MSENFEKLVMDTLGAIRTDMNHNFDTMHTAFRDHAQQDDKRFGEISTTLQGLVVKEAKLEGATTASKGKLISLFAGVPSALLGIGLAIWKYLHHTK